MPMGLNEPWDVVVPIIAGFLGVLIIAVIGIGIFMLVSLVHAFSQIVCSKLVGVFTFMHAF